MRSASLELECFDGVENNPRRATIDRLAADAATRGIDLVVGLGGGSVLDAAKAVAMLVPNGGSCGDYEGKNLFAERPLPFIAIPTTCGTGSEVTWVSVISDPAERRKLSVKGDGMFPDLALVDSDTLETLPTELMAYTGIDALTHAVECYISTAANPVSDALAEKAIALTFRHLSRAVSDPGKELDARDATMRASTLAGIAFGNADVTAVHCLSESIGGIFDLAHGMLNAIFLAPVLRYQFETVRPRLARLEQRISGDDGKDAAGRFVERVEALVTELRIPSFSSTGISPGDFPAIAESAERNNSNGSNAQPMQAHDYEKILESTP